MIADNYRDIRERIDTLKASTPDSTEICYRKGCHVARARCPHAERCLPPATQE